MSWTKIHGEELQRLQERLELAQQSTSLEASTLRTPFYQNGELVRMHDGTGAMFMVAAGPGELHGTGGIRSTERGGEQSRTAARLVPRDRQRSR